MRFRDTPLLRVVCLWLGLSKRGISEYDHWTAITAEKLIQSPLRLRTSIDQLDAGTFHKLEQRHRSDHRELRERRRAARLALLKTHQEFSSHLSFLPREKYSDMAFEFLERLFENEKKREQRDSGEERGKHAETLAQDRALRIEAGRRGRAR